MGLSVSRPVSRVFLLSVLLTAAAGRLPAEDAEAEPPIPLAGPPQTLRDASGAPELDLIDPFQRRAGNGLGEENAAGLSRTSFGDIPDEFRILSIVILQDTNTPPMALIKLNSRAEPNLVRPGDLVRIDRDAVAVASRGKRKAPAPAAALSADALEALNRYTFYLNVKDIQPTYIEVFHNKQSPEDTIILSW
jgi:hypothetical protein